MAAAPRICVPIVSRSQDINAIAPLAYLFEVRIDLIGKGWQSIAALLPRPWLACNRRVDEGGKAKGGEAKRIGELGRAVEIGAQLVDIELSTPGVAEIVKDFKGRAEVIVSYHNLVETPPVDRLRQVIINQLAAGADICKVVTTAQRFKDNMEILELIGLFPDIRIIAFAMGDAGQVSRIMSPLVGGYLTYASSEKGSESAAGQMAVADVRKIYRMLDNK
jgi:3-dehydroquinate dehydratase type I